MPVDPSPVVLCAASWRPSESWASTVRPAYETLIGGATGKVAAYAWADLVMMMGDTRAAPLALIVVLHAERVLGSFDDRRLASHRNLCLMDLGLAHADGPVRIAALHDPDVVPTDVPGFEGWLARALIPFDGDLERAAWFALRTACVRTGVLDGPDPTP